MLTLNSVSQLKIWRNADSTGAVHPGMVDQRAVRSKLSKQLKIDLDENEKLHLRETPVVKHEDLKAEELDSILEEISTEEECTVQIKKLGDFVAKITLAGGYVVPLRVTVLKR